jgi:surface protein
MLFIKRITRYLKWDAKNVTNTVHMFDWCRSLIEIPDISKWDTENDIDMSRMAYDD